MNSKKMGRPVTGRVPNFSIRIRPEALQKAREAAFGQQKTLGGWLEEAIIGKIERDTNPPGKAGRQ